LTTTRFVASADVNRAVNAAVTAVAFWHVTT